MYRPYGAGRRGLVRCSRTSAQKEGSWGSERGLGTILAPTCPMSCQPRCSPHPSSGSVGVAWFHPFSRSTTAPTQSCAAAPAPSPSESGCRMWWSPSAALRLAQQQMPPGSPRHCGRPPGSRQGSPAATKQASFSDLLVSSPSSSAVLPREGPGPVFLLSKEVFSHPGPVAPSQPPQKQYTSRPWAPPQRLDL
jgi:hypothetical protein